MTWRLIAAVCALTGCQAADRPPGMGGGGTGGGGGGGGGGSGVDAAAIDGGGSRVIGNACQISDVRFPTACVAADLSGLDVTIRGGESTTTNAAGDFDLAYPGVGGAIVSAANTLAYQAAVIEYPTLVGGGNVTDLSVPLLAAGDWEDLKAAIGTSEPLGSATIAVYVRDGSTPAAGAQVISNSAAFAPFYDGASVNDWSADGLSGAAGAALVFGVPADIETADLTIIGPGGSPTVVVTEIPVVDGAITSIIVPL